MIKTNILARIQQDYPQFQIKYKNQSTFMKILGIILFFNPDFMNNYITTIGNTTYYPSQSWVDSNPESAFITLLHEIQHVKQSNQLGNIWFSFLYLFIFPIFVADYRKKFELAAYQVSLYTMNALGIDIDSQVAFINNQFTSSAYLWMWLPGVATELSTTCDQIRAGAFKVDEVVDDCIKLYQNK